MANVITVHNALAIVAMVDATAHVVCASMSDVPCVMFEM